MAILTETIVRRRPRKTRGTMLTEAERDHVRAALRFLRVRLGGWEPVAQAMGVRRKLLERVLYGERNATAGHALRTARAAGVPMEDVLTGKYPKPGACALCGHVARKR